MFSVGLACVSVRQQHYSKSYEWIVMKFYVRVQVVKRISDKSFLSALVMIQSWQRFMVSECFV